MKPSSAKLYTEIKDENITHRQSYKVLLSLMLAGALPFLFLTILLHTNLLPKARVLTLLLSYAAVILSFLGGIQWGIGIIKLEDKTLSFPHIFTLSILPALLAWLLLLIDTPWLQLVGFILSFAIAISIDARLTLKKIIPLWFLKLRLVITLIVITLLTFCYSTR